MIEEVPVATMAEFTEVLNCIPNHFVFRGQGNAVWRLQSTLERFLGKAWSPEAALKSEKLALERFKSKFHIYCGDEHVPSSKLGWLSTMQHYGAPTRLIDFTESPWIALYFALEAYVPAEKSSFAIYAIDYTSLMEESLNMVREVDRGFQHTIDSINGHQDEIFENVIDRYSHSTAWITEPSLMNARIDRQCGTFLIAGSLSTTVEEILSQPRYSKCTMQKIVAPANLYEGAYVALRKMAINAKMIYGDLAGLARSIRMEQQIYFS